jgi:hypothetical protein
MAMSSGKARSSATLCAVAALAGATAFASAARAGSFDAQGNYRAAPDAVLFERFVEPPDIFLPTDSPAECLEPMSEVVAEADALEGGSFLRLAITEGCSERYRLALPVGQASYRASLWLRHGSLDAQIIAIYPADSGLETMAATLFPTGRTTSDGWIELASNEFPVDANLAEVIYLRVADFASLAGTDLDALELVPAGEYLEPIACAGVGDPVCGAEQLCMFNRCRIGRIAVPPLPPDGLRDELVDSMKGQLRAFFGGRKTRLEDLPAALDILDELRSAPTAWQFWSGWARAIRRLHDWHTSAGSDFKYRYSGTRRLNVCFIEGDADASALVWPKDPRYLDLLVSHTGSDGTQGIAQGDRLVAVDGLHPIEWALGLREVDWGFWQACDSDVYAEQAERMRGLILRYASELTIIHCDATTGSCDSVPETYVVSELPDDPGGSVSCDNRPFYHFADPANNPGPDHGVGWSFFQGQIAGTTPEEAIYGMVWDTLYGGGDPAGWVNQHLSDAIALWKQSARGVILDHRAGNGGTVDAVQTLSRLVRPVETILIDRSWMSIAGDDGPATQAEGIALFQEFEDQSGLVVGAEDYDPELPVALVLHRDGSASDYMPFALKGAPKVRLFAPHATAGAFSTFYQIYYWGSLSYQFGSGDTISKEGQPLIGHGVEPDEVVVPKQSDILAGRDTLHEAALAWVRQELKP